MRRIHSSAGVEGSECRRCFAVGRRLLGLSWWCSEVSCCLSWQRRGTYWWMVWRRWKGSVVDPCWFLRGSRWIASCRLNAGAPTGSIGVPKRNQLSRGHAKLRRPFRSGVAESVSQLSSSQGGVPCQDELRLFRTTTEWLSSVY